MKRWGLALVVCFLVLTAVYPVDSSTPSKPVSGGTLRQAFSEKINALDPALATTDYERAIASALFDTLMIYEAKTGGLTYGIARTVQLSKDGKVFRLGLRRGVRFHNGRELVAADVKYTFDRIADPRTGSPVQSLLSCVEGYAESAARRAAELSGIRIIDDYTVQISLLKPCMYFLSILGEPAFAIVPKDPAEKNPRDFGQKPVGSGPFKLAEFNPNRVSLVRNEQYWREGVPYLSGLVWTYHENYKMTYDAFVSGQLDMMPLDPEWMDALKSRGTWNSLVQSWPATTTFYLGFTVKRAPFDKVEVRQALALVFNPAAYLGLHGAGGMVAQGILPPGIGGHDPARKRPERSLQTAQQLMTRAGFPGGRGFPTVRLVAGSMTGFQKNLLDRIREDFELLGLKVQIRQVSPETYEEIIRKGEADVFSYGWQADYPDPDNFLYSLFHSSRIGTTNLTGYSNPQLDTLLDRAAAERDAKTRPALYKQAEDQILKDFPVIPTFHPLVLRVLQPNVRGAVIHPVIPIFFDTIWLDK